MPSLLVLQKSTYACKPLQSKAHGVNAELAAGAAIKESWQEGSWSLWRPSASMLPLIKLPLYDLTPDEAWA